MISLNPTHIEDFPEITSLLSTDKVILFNRTSAEEYVPSIVDISSFIEHVLLAGELQSLEERTKSLEKRYEDIEREYVKQYMTPEQVKEKYCTISSFDSTINKLEKVTDFKTKLNDKASKEYLEAKYNEILKKCQAMKRYLGSEKEWKNGSATGVGYKEIAAAAARGEPEEEVPTE